MKKIYILLLIMVTFFLQACEIVDTGKVGIETEFGEVQGKPLPEGFYWYNIFTSNITEMDTRTKKFRGESSPFTNDVQESTIVWALNYNLERSASDVVFQTVGMDYANLLIPQEVEGALTTVIGKWDAVTLIGKRDVAKQDVFKILKSQLALKHIILTDFEIESIDYKKEFKKSVEDKVVAIQRAEESKNKTVRIEEEAKQKIIAAEAEAKSMQIRSASLKTNKALIDWEAVQKWNGVLPNIMMGGDGAVPFINLNK